MDFLDLEKALVSVVDRAEERDLDGVEIWLVCRTPLA